jgi:anti-sigma factor RsiW
MTELVPHNSNCRSVDVAAYLDGELRDGALSAFEEHLKECRSCSEKLEEQRRLLCTLDMAFGEEKALTLPVDFARVVTAHAQTDMSGVRGRHERSRALQLCTALALFSFALLGSAALSDSVLEPLRVFGRLAAAGFGIVWRAVYDAGAGLVVIMRITARFTFESHPLGVLSYLLLAGALYLLLRLIRSYHRARAVE